MTNDDTPKYRRVRDVLADELRAGNFEVGGRLPSEREIAARFGVSYITARRAVTELVEEELLERRVGSGIYVRPQSREKLSQVTLNAICSAQDGSIARSFLEYAHQAAQEHGWRLRIARLHAGLELPLIRAIDAGEPALIFLYSPYLSAPLYKAMRQADGRAVLIGNVSADAAVPSVMADDASAIRLAMQHLRGAGHERIALLDNHPEYPIHQLQIETWKQCQPALDEKTLQRRLIIAHGNGFKARCDIAYRAMQKYLRQRNREATALLCLDDEMTLGALAACRDNGVPVPDAISFLCSGDSHLMEYAYPPVTVIDIDMKSHIRVACDIIQEAVAGRLKARGRQRLILPRLIQRQSVAPPRHNA